MAKPDIEALRAKAQAKAGKVKREIADQRALAKNPVPEYVEPVQYQGDAEKDSAAELDAVQAGFRQRAKDEGKRFELATDSEYWACICFQSREQKEAFLKALSLFDIGDKYLDGQEVAKVLGVNLPPADIPYNPDPRVDKTWIEFT